jgi:predicted nucleic acid-binding protein
VAGEFYNTATSPKRQFRLSRSLATEYVDTWLNFPTASVNASTVRDALQLSAKFQINYWDAAIIAAARELGCHTVYSEDLSDGQDYDGVVIVNPFSSAFGV